MKLIKWYHLQEYLIQEEAKRDGPVQLIEVVCGGISSMCINTQWWGVKNVETDSSQQCLQKQGNGHKLKYTKFHLNEKRH